MGTGLIAPFYRVAERLRLRTIKDRGGVLLSTAHHSSQQRSIAALRYANRAKSDCALDVASTYPGGDYFEFGLTGLSKFRSFLGAFYLHHGDGPNFTDARFYAFDIFGNPDQGSRARRSFAIILKRGAISRRMLCRCIA